MTWKDAEESGARTPLGGFTKNLLGEEVWTLNSTVEVGCIDRR